MSAEKTAAALANLLRIERGYDISIGIGDDTLIVYVHRKSDLRHVMEDCATMNVQVEYVGQVKPL